jgi:hypothetical protein
LFPSEAKQRAWVPIVSQTELEKLSGKIANCENRRHRTTHGLRAWEVGDPDMLKTFSTRPRVEFEIGIDPEGLVKLAEEIGEVNFVLAYPNGIEDFYAEKAASGGSFSRGFLKAVRPIKREVNGQRRVERRLHQPSISLGSYAIKTNGSGPPPLEFGR